MSAGPPPPLPAAPAGGRTTAPVPPADELPGDACPLCGTPLREDQDWCVHCGAAARTRLASPPGWRAPVTALVVLVIVCLIGLTVALVKLAGGSGTVTVTLARPPAVVVGPTGATGAAGATGAPLAGATAPPAATGTTAPAVPSTGASGLTGRTGGAATGTG